MFKCDYCRAPTAPGENVCKRKHCREREAQAQTNQKCREFGIGPYYEVSRPFPRVPP